MSEFWMGFWIGILIYILISFIIRILFYIVKENKQKGDIYACFEGGNSKFYTAKIYTDSNFDKRLGLFEDDGFIVESIICDNMCKEDILSKIALWKKEWAKPEIEA